ncbi:MAG: hypothetical protein ABL308_04080 [Oceanicaulis sp.]
MTQSFKSDKQRREDVRRAADPDDDKALLDELDFGQSTTRLAMYLAATGLGAAALVAIVMG